MLSMLYHFQVIHLQRLITFLVPILVIFFILLQVLFLHLTTILEELLLLLEMLYFL
ncbi:hypothetical protein [Tundra vole stool-associated circular virus]|nr:hypothetical protein [Tundra vole stool-associated circular virus]